MANKSLKQRILALSPHFEMLARKIYWDNIDWFQERAKKKRKRNKKKRKKNRETGSAVEIEKLIQCLSENGIDDGDLVVVHSSFGELKRTGKTPQEIIDALRGLIGESGTLAMPAIRRYQEDPQVNEFVTKNMEGLIATYNTQESKVWTGLLPKVLLQQPDAVVSRFPLNSMVAVGPEAQAMMKDNLKGEKPLPNGVNSSWNYCAINGAYVIGLGIDLTHSLTMIHVAEDVMDQDWPVKDWYRERQFHIVDGDFKTNITVRERNPKWGAYKFGERTLSKDLTKHGILKSFEIDGVTIEILRADELIRFLNERNSNGYPYFWV